MEKLSQKIGDIIEDIISCRIEVVTNSTWFKELVDQKVRSVLKEKEE